MNESVPLYGDVMVAELPRAGSLPLHVCRWDDGNLLLMIEDEVAALGKDEVRWLAGVLNGALDSWPVVEG